MAWIRRVRTASGATAVQIAEYDGGRRKIVAHVGSAHTEAELGILLERARELLGDPAQGVFDLGVEPAAPRARLVRRDAAPPLFGTKPPGGAPAGAGPARVVPAGSRLLFQVLDSVYGDLGFSALGDDVFRDLVLARVVEPTSILDTPRVLADLGRKAASDKTLRRTLARCADRGYRDQVAELCFAHAHARASGDASLVLYDVTTLYFEAEHEDALRKVGYSKERRVDPQVVAGLLVSRHGFPLEIGCFEGNKAEKLTILPVIRQFQARHGLGAVVVVADAGMLSAANLADLDEAGLGFIVGSRVTKAPVDLESHFRWHGDAFTDGQVTGTLTPKAGKNKDNNPALKAEPAWGRQDHPKSWRAVWAFSAKRFARDNRTLTAQENRARDVIGGASSARAPRFVRNAGGSQALDEKALARARKLAGLKGYVTNLPVSVMPPGEVMSRYHDLWHVEQSFRMSKTDLAARPVFVRRRDAIEAHLTIVFTAVTLAAKEPGAPEPKVLRQALFAWAFNPATRDTDPPPQIADALDWAERASLPVAGLEDTATVRLALAACARNLTGKAAAGSTQRRKRSVFYNALGYAVEQGHLSSNPVDRIQWTAPAVAASVDRRVVVSPAQARSLLAAVRGLSERGQHLEAFFGCLYYAALRPSEAVMLRESDLYLPRKGWGRIVLAASAARAGTAWTDDGTARQERGLKHRADNETRTIPIPPELVRLLRAHIRRYGTTPDGRIFQTTRGGILQDSGYNEVWTEARQKALTPAQYRSPLGRRPYDLRHAAVSLWLNSGVPATEVARRAGHGVAVLLKIYAHCIDGQADAANQRITDALGAQDAPDPEPAEA